MAYWHQIGVAGRPVVTPDRAGGNGIVCSVDFDNPGLPITALVQKQILVGALSVGDDGGATLDP